MATSGAEAENSSLREKRAKAFQFTAEQGHMINLGSQMMGVNKILRESLKPENAKMYYGRTGMPRIYTAIRMNNIEYLRELVSNGADIEAQYMNLTPLMWAVQEGNVKMVEELCRLGANVNALENQYSGATYNRSVRSPLLFAVEQDRIDLVNLLLNYGADITIGAGDGSSVLDIAAKKGNVQMLDLLLAKGAESIVNLVDPFYNTTPLQTAIFAGCLGCVKSLVAAGGDLSMPSTVGLNSLGLAKERLDNALYWQNRFRGTTIQSRVQADAVRRAQEVFDFLEEISRNQKGGKKRKQKKIRATRKRIRTYKR